MKDMGVFDGDIAVVRQNPSASNGEVVVAVIEGEATLKRFFKRDDTIVLHAENPVYEDIVIAAPQSVYIAGKLVGVIRRCAV
jgi:repressor LexA